MFLKRVSVIAVLCMFSIGVSAQVVKAEVELQGAYKAEGSLQLENSRNLFLAVLVNDTATKEEQCKALRSLAIQDWKFYKDYDAAIKRLLQADSIGDYRSETWIVAHRIELEAKNYTKSMEAAKKSMQIATSDADKIYAKHKYANAVFEQALFQINNRIAFDTRLLKEASGMLQEILAINPTHVNAAETLLGISLLRNDGDMALKGWLSYYRFSDMESVYAYFKEPARQLQKVLSKWNTTPLNTEEKITLITTLGHTRFYTYAAMMATVWMYNENNTIKNNKEIQDIVAYSKYLGTIEKYTDEYYRKMTLEEGSTEDFMSFLTSESELLYNAITIPEKEKDTFNLRALRNLIRSRFGAFTMLGRTSSSPIFGLVMGHVVNERVREVEQYGHSADFNFTELDMMISNGYPSWYWEDRGAGGFAIEGGFLRVKKMFKFLGISAWENVTDSVKRKKAENKIHKTVYESSLSSDKNAVLAGLATKLELDALDQLYNQLVKEGYKGVTLQLKFIERYDSYRDNATMFAHEGRHSLDRIILQEAYRTLGIPTIEYRARLSQIVFSESPKLELANMVNGTGSTGSGLANKMIVEVAETWIKANTPQIKGYDKNKIPIAQLYLLTDDQIKAIYRGVDPFYKKK
ncbi:tetratricopeptide repeat protein [Dokdonia ponticola]|uniref:Tetratricopeptide repeat protein n=1 Tax=Dokdonia ponticola TaxID=2041041 RepID=A0ABV9HU79_9FLAO